MDDKIYQQVVAYFRQEMDPVERVAFEEKVRNDAAFAEEATEMAQLYQTVQKAGDEHLRADFNALAQELTQKQKESDQSASVRPMWYRYRYAVAAAIILMLAIALPIRFFLLPSSGGSTNQELFAANYSLPAIPDEVRGGDDDLDDWMKHWDEGNFAAAEQSLEMALADPDYPSPSRANLYLGLSRMEQAKYASAKTALTKVSPNSYDYDDARWYLALAHIMTDDLKAAEEELKSVSKISREYRKKANNLIKAIKTNP